MMTLSEGAFQPCLAPTQP